MANVDFNGNRWIWTSGYFFLLLAKKERRKFILGESHDQKGGPKNAIIPSNIVIQFSTHNIIHKVNYEIKV